MRSLMTLVVLSLISACHSTRSLELPHRADTPERRYTVCMKSILGNFADMKPTETRLKAAELCRSALQPTEPTASR